MPRQPPEMGSDRDDLAKEVDDPPIILVTLALASKLAELRRLLGVVSIAGGAFVLFLAWESFLPGRQEAEALARSFWRFRRTLGMALRGHFQ